MDKESDHLQMVKWLNQGNFVSEGNVSSLDVANASALMVGVILTFAFVGVKLGLQF
jgi:hypothetical protein